QRAIERTGHVVGGEGDLERRRRLVILPRADAARQRLANVLLRDEAEGCVAARLQLRVLAALVDEFALEPERALPELDRALDVVDVEQRVSELHRFLPW